MIKIGIPHIQRKFHAFEKIYPYCYGIIGFMVRFHAVKYSFFILNKFYEK